MRQKGILIAFAAIALLPIPARAFLPNPDLLTVSPAVARAGSTVEVTIKGKNLDEAARLRFSDPRITGEPAMSPADDFHPEPRPQKDRFTVTIPADTEPGVYEVRSLGYFGLSTARPFLVLPADDSPGRKNNEKGTDAEDQVGPGDLVATEAHARPETALPLEADDGVLSVLPAGGHNYYRFDAEKGERFLVEILAERLDSRGDLVLTILDEDGRELAGSREHFGRDPFVDFTAPAAGRYFVSVNDVLYQGGRDFFYHLRLGQGPLVDFVFPPAGAPGTETSFTFFGRLLPGGSLGENWQLDGKPLETVEKRIAVPAEVAVPAAFHPGIPRQGILPGFLVGLEGSNRVKIGFATAPVVREREPSPARDQNRNQEKKPVPDQRLKVPSEVAGRFDQPGDSDRYRFSAKAGKAVWIEVYSHRHGAATDPVVVIEKIGTDDAGNETFEKVAKNDDTPSFYGQDNLDDLNVDSYDPALSFTPEEDGNYRLTLVNQRGTGGPGHVYRLALRDPRPGFQLLVGTELTKTINNDAFPAAPLLRRGGSMVYRVMALRADGFEGDITVTAEGLPEGVTAPPLTLSGGTRQGFLTVLASKDAETWSGPVRIVGRAKIGDRQETSVARAASLLWGLRVFGNLAQVRSRLDMETVLSVIGSESEPTRIDAAGNQPGKVWKVTEGDTLELPVQLEDDGRRVGNLQVNVHGFPGLHRSPPAVAIGEKDREATLKFPFVKSGNFELAPGRYQFVLQGVGNAAYRRNPEAAERARAEHGRLGKLAADFEKQLAAAKKENEAAKKDLAAVESRAQGAADDQARKALEPERAAARKQSQDTAQALKTAQADLAHAKQLAAAAAKEADRAEAEAKEQRNQFATYSPPITVVVEAKPEEKK